MSVSEYGSPACPTITFLRFSPESRHAA